MENKRLCILIACIGIFVLLLTSCNGRQKEPQVDSVVEEAETREVVKSEKEDRIEVRLINSDGVDVGYALLREEKDGVHIDIEAHHLPVGLHGVHIHERGLCEWPDFESAGGHFNPTGKRHGFHDPEGPHAGDLENIEVDESGTVRQSLHNDRITLKKGEKSSVISEKGTALLIHAKEDDYITQPAGNSGERIVCGVITPYE